MRHITETLLIAMVSFFSVPAFNAKAQDSPRVEKLYLSTDKDIYNMGEKIHFSGFLVNSYTNQKLENASQFIYVELLNSKDSLISRIKVKRDSLGFRNTLELSNQLPQGQYRLRAYTQWMKNFDTDFMFTKNIKVFNPVKKDKIGTIRHKDDFDIQFFPESGILMPDIWENVAYKAIGSDGLGTDVNLTVYDREGNEVTSSSSAHLGMGSFKINVNKDEKYRIVAECNGKVKTFPMPETASSGALVQCVYLKNQIICETTLSSDLDPHNYELVLNCRGAEMYKAPLVKHKTVTKFEKGYIPDGISHVTIYDRYAKVPVARRLIFVNNGTSLSPEIRPLRKEMKERELETIDFQLNDKDGKPLKGDFSVSVTDAGAVEADTAGNNIMTWLLMSSDIKGYVENPKYYFQNKENEKDLDLLMLTQGWASYMDDNYYSETGLEYGFEDDQVISGAVYGFFGNKAKSPKIMFAEPKSKIFELIPLGENNSFNIHTDFPDSTVYFLQAHYKNGKKGNTLTLKMEPERFASKPSGLPDGLTGRKAVEISDNFEEQALQTLSYSEEGAMFLNLDATTIIAEREDEDDHILSVLNASHTMIGSDLERFSGMSVFDAVRTFPGVSGVDTLYIRGGQDPALFYVDDMPVDYSEVQTLMASNVESIEMVNGEEAQFLTANGSGGLFVIQLKDGVEINNVEALPSFAKVQYLGWKKPDRYYQPKYEVDSVKNSSIPDLRTTIAWEPVVRTDRNGHARICFYSSDRPDKYRIMVEGVTEKGKIICSESYIGKKSQESGTDDL